MINIRSKNLDTNQYFSFINEHKQNLNTIKQELINNTIIGNNFTGWFDYYNSNEINMIINKINQYKKEWVNKNIDTVVIIGIGGSMIGTRAVIEMVTNKFDKQPFDLIFVDGISTKYNASLIKYLNDKNWSIVNITKSSSTFETKVNFHIFLEQLKNSFDLDWNERIVLITENNNNYLNNLAESYNIKTLYIDKNIGGRFSTITPVGLFVFSLLNLDLYKFIEGYQDFLALFLQEDVTSNTAVNYALSRYFMKNKQAKDIEVFCTYEQDLRWFSEYYKQIFAESEGKNENVLIPTIANYSNDLHSIGQLYQQGPKNFFETILNYKMTNGKVMLNELDIQINDQLEHLFNCNLFELNHDLMNSVIIAHDSTPSIIIDLDQNDIYHAGQLLAFLNISAVFSARLNNTNPFDQPGVENYKNNLKKILDNK